MILHTVTFRLKKPSAEKDFMNEAAKLADIPGVLNFECLRQVGKKNNFALGLSMEFATENDYRGYCDHPDHVFFVENIWIPQVEEFMEIDYVKYETDS